jgi:UDP-N-acetylmuramoyl-tripeptide--D-alanyl-D-alanine ligase
MARARLHVPVIGVTGSAGKTTTRSLVALALSPLGPVHQTVANLNNHLGVPMTLLATPETAKAVVVEMGTSGPGEIGHLADIARPSHRLIVNVGPAHLQELGSLAGVAHEKGALFRSATPGDVVLVNEDDPFVQNLPIPSGVRRVGYGESRGAEVRLERVELDPIHMHTSFSVAVTGHPALRGVVPALGRQFAHNATAALAVAWAVGVDLRAAAERFAGYEPVGMRQRTVRFLNGALVINDAYNANPTSTRASLDALAALDGRKVAALGDMLELGPDEVAFHREVLEYALSLGLARILAVGPRFRAAAQGLSDVETFETPEAAAVSLGALRSDDRLLVKGSRGMAMEQLLHALQGEVR